jgi:hypothetical protein
MSESNTRAAMVGLAAATVMTSLPLPASAQELEGPWQWQAAIYAWVPTIGGSTRFPESGGGSSVDVSMRDVLDALKMTFMGNLAVTNGHWGLWTDLVYADFGHSKQNFREFSIGGQPLPGGVDANMVLDLKSWIWTTLGTYRFASTPEYTADALAGVRMLDMQQTLSWSLNGNIRPLPISRTGTSQLDLNNWDAVIGVKGVASFGDERKWFVPYYLDIGAGESKFTWQANLGIGYKFGWGALVASWRYLDYEMKSDQAIQSLSMNGPLVGAVFQF